MTLFAAAELDPFGADRDDLRAAWMTLHTMSATAEIKDGAVPDVLKGLLGFTEQQRHDAENEKPGTFGQATAGLG